MPRKKYPDPYRASFDEKDTGERLLAKFAPPDPNVKQPAYATASTSETAGMVLSIDNART